MGTLHSCSGIRLDVKAVAKAYGIPKGDRSGYDADWSVDLNTYRPVLREELLTKCGVLGWNLTGWPVTIVGGEIVYHRGQLNTEVRGQALTFL